MRHSPCQFFSAHLQIIPLLWRTMGLERMSHGDLLRSRNASGFAVRPPLPSRFCRMPMTTSMLDQ